jgi:hypothetical protein
MNNTPKCSDEVQQRRMRATITKLAVECPVARKNPKVCPLNSVRKKRMPTRVQWVDSLPDEDITFLSGYHKVCQKWQKAGCP